DLRAGSDAPAGHQCAGTAAVQHWSSDVMRFRSRGETPRPRGCRAVRSPVALAYGWLSLYIKDEQKAMELRHLRYFVAVAEERSFIGAAARLRVAQPALSKQIRDLEIELGTVLLERGPRGVYLTTAGRAFLVEARHTLDVASHAVASARGAAVGRDSPLRFAHGELAAYGIRIERLLASFRDAN